MSNTYVPYTPQFSTNADYPDTIFVTDPTGDQAALQKVVADSLSGTAVTTAKVETDANGVTNLILADGSQILLLNGDTGSASGVAFSVPTGYTVGTAATALDLTNLLVDTNSAIVDLADNSFLVPSDATHFRAFVHVLFAANATGHRYVAVEQYFQTIATWTAVSGAYMELAALGGGKATTVSFNTPYMACGASFPKMRIAVGQDSGGALNCTPIGATFEFLR